VPPQSEEQLRQLIHDVFAQGATTAARPTMLVVVLVLVVGALAALFMTTHVVRRAAAPQAGQKEAVSPAPAP
jgi:hypothetical protein